MKPALALHRSFTFWTGLLLVTFTCWAWWDSCRNASGLYWGQFGAASGARGIVISREVAAGAGGFLLERDSAQPYPGDWPRAFFPAPFLVRARKTFHEGIPIAPPFFREMIQIKADGAGPGSWSLYLPYWLLLLALLIPWSLPLLWRARRLKRASLPVSA